MIRNPKKLVKFCRFSFIIYELSVTKDLILESKSIITDKYTYAHPLLSVCGSNLKKKKAFQYKLSWVLIGKSAVSFTNVVVVNFVSTSNKINTCVRFNDSYMISTCEPTQTIQLNHSEEATHMQEICNIMLNSKSNHSEEATHMPEICTQS